MRICRILAKLHAHAVGCRKRLPISEPHARCATIRRTAQGTRILCTNTDTSFVPRASWSLLDLAADLAEEPSIGPAAPA